MREKKILIVEDHADCRELLSLVLSRSGYTVVQAGTGLDGLERASATAPDLIVMDFGLPDTTGYEVILSLKGNPVTGKIPVIVTTGYMTPEVTKRAYAAGAAMVLTKPYGVDQLRSVIDQLLATDADCEPQSMPISARSRLNLH